MTEALIGFFAVLALVLLRMPIAFAMGLVGMVGYTYLNSFRGAASMVGRLIIDTPLGQLKQSAPVAWQPLANGERLPVLRCGDKELNWPFGQPEILALISLLLQQVSLIYENRPVDAIHTSSSFDNRRL